MLFNVLLQEKEKDAESSEVFAVGSEISVHLTFFQDDAISNLT